MHETCHTQSQRQGLRGLLTVSLCMICNISASSYSCASVPLPSTGAGGTCLSLCHRLLKCPALCRARLLYCPYLVTHSKKYRTAIGRPATPLLQPWRLRREHKQQHHLQSRNIVRREMHMTGIAQCNAVSRTAVTRAADNRICMRLMALAMICLCPCHYKPYKA